MSKRAVMQDERNYYLAIIRPENLERLAQAGMTYYAVKSPRTLIKPGDRIALYRSRGPSTLGGTSGIVGVFEVTGDPTPPGASDHTTFSKIYSTVIPWRPIAISLEQPLPIAPLVSQLKMFPNKQNYGAALQTTLKRLSPEDYEIMESAITRMLKSR